MILQVEKRHAFYHGACETPRLSSLGVSARWNDDEIMETQNSAKNFEILVPPYSMEDNRRAFAAILVSFKSGFYRQLANSSR